MKLNCGAAIGTGLITKAGRVVCTSMALIDSLVSVIGFGSGQFENTFVIVVVVVVVDVVAVMLAVSLLVGGFINNCKGVLAVVGALAVQFGNGEFSFSRMDSWFSIVRSRGGFFPIGGFINEPPPVLIEVFDGIPNKSSIVLSMRLPKKGQCIRDSPPGHFQLPSNVVLDAVIVGSQANW